MKESVSHSTENTRRRSRRFGMRPIALLVALASLPLMEGCRLEMYDQPRYEPLEASDFFADSMGSRPHISGTVGRSNAPSSHPSSFAEPSGGQSGIAGIDSAGWRSDSALPYAERVAVGITDVDRNGSIPMPVTRQLIVRGQERYNIFCSPCHGRTGDGKGMIVQRGFPAPPSFHLDRLRQSPDGHFYDVITNGFGVMFSYASRVAPEDRWAITAYIRALQLSQHAPLQDLSPEERTKLQGSGE